MCTSQHKYTVETLYRKTGIVNTEIEQMLQCLALEGLDSCTNQ